MNKWILDVELLKRMNRVAVIDTGVNLKYREFKNINMELVGTEEACCYNDANGHGTSCCGEILKYNPDASLTIMPILNENCICRLDKLYDALLYCSKSDDIGIINLSLAFTINDCKIMDVFNLLLREIRKKGKIIVASYKNKVSDIGYVYPYEFIDVLGVANSNTNTNNSFITYDQNNNKCNIFIDYYYMPYKEEKYKIFYGNSSLTAKLTGLISRELSKIDKREISINEVINLCNMRLERDYRLENEFYSEVNLEQIQSERKKLEGLWSLFCSKKDKRKLKGIESVRAFYVDYGGEFLKLIENELGFQFDFRGITIDDLKSLNKLITKCLYWKLGGV